MINNNRCRKNGKSTKSTKNDIEDSFLDLCNNNTNITPPKTYITLQLIEDLLTELKLFKEKLAKTFPEKIK